METINWEVYYDWKELSDKLDKVILVQSKTLSKNLLSKRKLIYV